MQFLFVIMTLLAFSITEARADESWYVSARVGTGTLLDVEDDISGTSVKGKFDQGFGFSGALGYRWNKFRLEGELAYDVNDVDEVQVGVVGISVDGDVASLSFMLNGWRDFPQSDQWSVNLGGGLGLAVISTNDISVLGVAFADESETEFALQLGAGLGYAITRDATLTVDYRFFIVDAEDYLLHRIGIGVRMDF